MHGTTVLIVVGLVIVALVVIGVIAAVMRRSRLRSLPEESVQRYAQSWRTVEARFVEDPSAAVREADQLAVAILQERGATMDDQHMPRELREARAMTRRDEGRGGTEGMRRAMLQYQGIVDDAVGIANRKWANRGRREVA